MLQDKFTCTVGKSTTCSLQIRKEFISKLHATFELTETGVQLTDNGSQHGVYLSRDSAQFIQVNANEAVDLDVGDVVRFGPKDTTIQLTKMEITVCHSRLHDSDKKK